MGLFSNVIKFHDPGDLLGREKGKRARAAAEQAQELTKFDPINIASRPGMFGAKFERGPGGEVTGVRTTGGPQQIAGQLEALLGPTLAQSQQLFPRLGLAGATLTDRGLAAAQMGDPQAQARRELGLFESLRQPGREAQREELNARLLAQGRLGTTAGGEVEAALERQFEQQRAADALAAIQSARQAQAQQFGQGIQQLGLGTGLLSQQQQLRQGLFGQNLQNLLALQQAALQPIQLGGQLGAGKLAAGQAQTAALMQGAQAGGMSPGTMGGIAGAIGSMFSDERLKENIKPVGQENGFNTYEFNYIGSPTKYIGVLAQEVERVNPDAVTTAHNDYLAVDYNKIGVQFRRA